MAKVLGIDMGTTNFWLPEAGKMVGCSSKDLIRHTHEEAYGQT